MKLLIFFVLFLCPYKNFAQKPKQRTPLNIGDSVPDLVFRNVMNVPYSKTSLNSNPDKLLLVDMWATWCTSCIAAFPKADSLQNFYRDRIQFLLLNTSTDDNEQKIRALFKKLKSPEGQHYNFPIVWDTSGRMDKLFPHRAVPHVVWIYKKKVVAISHSYDVTKNNIESVLSGIPIRIPKKWEQFDFNREIPLLEAGNGGSMASLISKTVFTKYLEGAPNSIGIYTSKDSLSKRQVVMNNSILKLYFIAYSPFPFNRIVLEDGLSEILLRYNTADSAEKARNFYCYELTVPINTRLEDIRKKMKRDLDEQFHLRSSIEKRKVSCYALVKNADSIKSIGSLNYPLSIPIDGQSEFRWINQPISYFLDALNSQALGKTLNNPVILNETGYSGNVNIDLQIKKLQDIQSLKDALRHYGLDLIPVQREMDMLVISKSKE